MATPALLKHPFDNRRINIFSAAERANWCRLFACTETQLQTAVAIVGSRVADVERHVKGLAYPLMTTL